MKYAVCKSPAKVARLGREIFGISEKDDVKAAGEGIARLKKWFSSIGGPVSLKEAGIGEGEIDRIAENTAGLARVWGLKAYDKPVISEILNLCKA
jgi:alcohol dehydrogenase YqhD (iron-dependent ADH family)